MSVDGYSVVAGEYYDPLLHPTCANFGELSRRYIVPRVFDLLPRTRRILEVGAGKSTVAEIVRESNLDIKLTLLDSSKEMLESSRLWAEFYDFVVADARCTGLPQGGFDLVVSSLGDPYNTKEFWFEISRLLQPTGTCLFTAPAPEWALAFRSADHLTEAEFVLSGGAIVSVPSFVPTHDEQVALIEGSSLAVESADEFSISDLTGVISPKLKENLRTDRLVVLRGYQVCKAQ
jgi:SAM-dependent methyltransferase